MDPISPDQDYIPCLLAYCEYPGDPFRRIEDQEGVEFFGCTDEKLFGPDVDLMEASTQAGFSLIMNFKNALYPNSFGFYR